MTYGTLRSLAEAIGLARPLALSGVLGLSVALATAANPAGASTPKPKFDGRWEVRIVVESGDCKAQTVMIAVQDGHVMFSGMGASAHGMVGSNGLIKVNISDGKNVVKANGAVKGERGQGRWRSPGCRGSWEAQKS